MSTNPIPNTPTQRFDRAGSPINTFPVSYSLRAIQEINQRYQEQMRQNQATHAALEALNGIKNLDLSSSAP